MQTFLPYEDFWLSANVLDTKRLCKQIIEAKIIYDINTSGDTKRAWYNHPATKMWRGHDAALATYFNTCLKVWKSRGYKHKYKFIIPSHIPTHVEFLPQFIGHEGFHRSHQSNLVRKNPEYYKGFFPDVPDNLPYIWEV